MLGGLLAGGLCANQAARAQPAVKLVASDKVVDVQYGTALSLHGNILIAGANLHDARGEDAGAAYLYQKQANGWEEIAMLFAEDGEAGDGFGVSVAIDSGFAIVGALGDDDAGTNAGAAYIFQQQGDAWIPHTKLTASDGAANDGFGYAVDINGQLAVVGARGVDDKGNSSGAAYIFLFANDDWVQLGKLTAPDGTSGDLFGSSVSINTFYAVVGAVLADGAAAGTGAAYVFQNRGAIWLPYAKLFAENGNWLDQFGHATALAGHTLVVGARGDDTATEDAGAVYVYEIGEESVTPTAQLLADGASRQDYLGHAVALDGDLLVAGAPGDDDRGAGAGAAYVFERPASAWLPAGKLVPVDTVREFGTAVAAGGTEAATGAVGAVYVYALSSILTGTKGAGETPARQLLEVRGAYPNPFATQVVFDYALGAAAQVSVAVYDLRGRLVRRLHDGVAAAGRHRATWDGAGARGNAMPAGVYFLRVQAGAARKGLLVVRI